MLLVAPGLTTRSKKLLGTKGIATKGLTELNQSAEGNGGAPVRGNNSAMLH